MDSADKATNKAMSAAYKYAAIQAFCIPTEGDNDADATTHEVAPRQEAPPPVSDEAKAVHARHAAAINASAGLDALRAAWAAALAEKDAMPLELQNDLVALRNKRKAAIDAVDDFPGDERNAS